MFTSRELMDEFPLKMSMPNYGVVREVHVPSQGGVFESFR
jgi:hypothetical protein